jgi:hypothetical protein
LPRRPLCLPSKQTNALSPRTPFHFLFEGTYLRVLLGLLTVALFTLVGSTTTATAQTRVLSGLTVDIPLAGGTIQLMIASFERHGGGNCPTGECCKTATVTVYDHPLVDLSVLGWATFPNNLSLEGHLANGRPGSVTLTGVRILQVAPSTVNGTKGWTIDFCYDQMIVRLGGQDLE